MGTVDPNGVAKPSSSASGYGQLDRPLSFGKYVLLDRVSIGGMAEIYRAKTSGLGGFERIVAIKKILPGMAEDEDFITMFVDEAKIAGQLTHANICPIYELGRIGESLYIAMEFVWGKDLLQIINRFRRLRQHMPPQMAAWVASRICEGLDYAHKKTDRAGKPIGLIHRDMSPQNVLVSYDAQVKIIDFGIAKAASRNTRTQAGVLKGKFGYMSPEQVRGLEIDHRSDVFALGTCLHEMLTGERLFLGENDFVTLERVRNAIVKPPSELVADLPAELEAIVLKALSLSPDDRFQSAGEMHEALEQFLMATRPPYGATKLTSWMKTAFSAEIAREKHRFLATADVEGPVTAPTINAPGAGPGASLANAAEPQTQPRGTAAPSPPRPSRSEVAPTSTAGAPSAAPRTPPLRAPFAPPSLANAPRMSPGAGAAAEGKGHAAIDAGDDEATIVGGSLGDEIFAIAQRNDARTTLEDPPRELPVDESEARVAAPRPLPLAGPPSEERTSLMEQSSEVFFAVDLDIVETPPPTASSLFEDLFGEISVETELPDDASAEAAGDDADAAQRATFSERPAAPPIPLGAPAAKPPSNPPPPAWAANRSTPSVPAPAATPSALDTARLPKSRARRPREDLKWMVLVGIVLVLGLALAVGIVTYELARVYLLAPQSAPASPGPSLPQ